MEIDENKTKVLEIVVMKGEVEIVDQGETIMNVHTQDIELWNMAIEKAMSKLGGMKRIGDKVGNV